MNQLKTASSTLAVQVIGQAMLVAGLAGYRNDSPFSLGRHLRDAHSAALMVSNDRITGNSAALLAAYRGEEPLFA
jgi:acyl-CoA dehydrogenase